MTMGVAIRHHCTSLTNRISVPEEYTMVEFLTFFTIR